MSESIPHWLTQSSDEELLVAVRVQPRASRNAILLPEKDGERLKVRVTAPPLENAANAAVLKLFADEFGLRKSAVLLDAGKRSRNKRVRIIGISAAALVKRLTNRS